MVKIDRTRSWRKKDLTLPPELCTDGFPDHLFIEFEDIGFYR